MAHVQCYAHNSIDNGMYVCEYTHACTHMAYSGMHTGYTARAFLLLLFYFSSLSTKAGFKWNSWTTSDFQASSSK